MKFARLDADLRSGVRLASTPRGAGPKGETDDDPNGEATVGVVFGPQYGPVTAKLVEEVIRAGRARYDDLVFAGFSFDGRRPGGDRGRPEPQAAHPHGPHPAGREPGMDGLLKEQPGSQLFTVFGRPRPRSKAGRRRRVHRRRWRAWTSTTR